MNSFTIDEYKPCKTFFLIPEDRYSQFEAYCTKKDKKEITKLIIKQIQTKYNGADIRQIELTATSYVGIFNIPDIHNSSLIVRPKIGSIAFLQMLHYINEQDIIIQNIFTHGLEESSDFVKIFLHFLIKTIYELLITSIRKGYDLVQQDISFAKGRVDYLKTIKHLLKSSNLIACQYYKFNTNTLINKAIKYTLFQIRDVIPTRSIIYFREIMTLLNPVDISIFNLNDFNRITYNRLNMKYKNLLEFCSLILKNQMVSLEKGKISFPAFCFNSWNIFEEFIRKILRSYCHKKYEVKKEFLKTEDKSLNPDIYFLNKETGNIDLVIDVKYKFTKDKKKNKTKKKDKDYDQIALYREAIGRLYAQGKQINSILLYPEDMGYKDEKNIFYEFFNFRRWNDKNNEHLKDFSNKVFEYLKK